ncbi:MAG: glycosyltransferase family 1 protein [Actinomycetota bacterium]|nr:glycosyltransferase family 1 protein [Actinomycetota bacterium]
MSPTSSPARVGVNLLWLIPGVVGGSEEYTVNLLRAVSDLGARSPSSIRLRVYAQPTLPMAHPDLVGRFEVLTLPVAVRTKPARFALESSWLAWHSRRDALVHHGGGVAPYGTVGRSVVTIHDLQPLDLPQNFSSTQRRWFSVMLPRVARVANRVITPSLFTGRRAADLLGVEASRLSVVPPVHATVAPDVRSDPSGSRPAGSGRYLLYPAVSHRHKRHVDAVEAFVTLADRFADLRLVFTGSPGAAAVDLAQCIDTSGLGDRIDVLGRVPAQRLETLLRGATALVFPSVYEGFGNPLIEAMAHGVPVVAADATALPEVAGGAAVLVQPQSPRALAEGVERVLTDGALVARLVEAGRERAKDFTAEVAGRALLEAYGESLG